MEKFLTVTFFLTAACTLSAQDYIPLVQEQATWVINSYCYDGIAPFRTVFGYRINGDTIIDGTGYKKVYGLSFIGSLETTPLPPYEKTGEYLFGAIREDLTEKKVYARIFLDLDLEYRCTDAVVEKLWYDFSLEVGDTLPSCLFNNPYFDQDPISAIDTLFLFGENRRRWEALQGYAWQVEGLGTHTGLFHPNFDLITTAECGYHLIHYCIGPESECDIVDANSVRELSLPASTISIAPNPASGPVRIGLRGQEGIIEGVALFAPSGQLLREWIGNQEIDVSGMPAGLYWVRVRTSKGAGFGKLVVH